MKCPKPVTHGPKAAALAVSRIDRADFCVGSRLSLNEDVQLWRIDLDTVAQAESRWQAILSPDERDRAGRFHFDRDRRHFSAARGLLRIVLAAYLAAEPQDVRFRYSEKGKPELAEPYAVSGLTFNVSHSGGVALLGFTRNRPIGVDVEKVRDDFDTRAIARRFFSPTEQEQLAELAAEKRHWAFFRCWTLKEAFIKALGEGLSHPLHQFDVSVDAARPVSLVTRPDASEAERWQLQLIEAGPEHAAALAVQRRRGSGA
jgi:4'-phosphopantetheinyl transferase